MTVSAPESARPSDFDEIVAEAALMDLTEVRDSLGAPDGQAWPNHVLNEVELEFRRLLILRSLNPSGIEPSGFVALFANAVHDITGFGSCSSPSKPPRTTTASAYTSTFGRCLPEAWTCVEPGRFLGSSQPQIIA